MGLNDQFSHAREWRARAAAVFNDAVGNVKEGIGRVDVWVQDHLRLAAVVAVIAGVGVLGGLVAWQGTRIFVLAKMAAPLFSITSVVAGGGIAGFRWFRRRRDARKNEPPAATKPKEPVMTPTEPGTKSEEADTKTEEPVTISASRASEDVGSPVPAISGGADTAAPLDEPKSDESS
jgi:hypothetical protein